MIKETIIQKLINKNRYKSYCEIGYQHGGSFNRIMCGRKVSVDPAPDCGATYNVTSDEFFETVRTPFDIFLIDGLHHADQAERDIINAARCLSKNGAIVLHDTCPETELQARVPRESKMWMGDAYRAFVGFRQKYPEVESYTHNCDCGVSIIRPKGQLFEEGFIVDMTFEEFNTNKKELLNFI